MCGYPNIFFWINIWSRRKWNNRGLEKSSLERKKFYFLPHSLTTKLNLMFKHNYKLNPAVWKLTKRSIQVFSYTIYSTLFWNSRGSHSPQTSPGGPTCLCHCPILFKRGREFLNQGRLYFQSKAHFRSDRVFWICIK